MHSCKYIYIYIYILDGVGLSGEYSFSELLVDALRAKNGQRVVPA